MDNLFDFLEYKIKKENQNENTITHISIIEKTKNIIDEEHLNYLKKLKLTLYNDEEISSSGLEKREYKIK